MRRILQRRRQRLQEQRPQTITRTVTHQNTLNNARNRELSLAQQQQQSDLTFAISHAPSGTEEEIAAASKLMKILWRQNCSTIRFHFVITGHLESEHRQQIIDIQREIEQQAIRRREERRMDGPHMPPKIINSSTVRKFRSLYLTKTFTIQQTKNRRSGSRI